MADPVLLHIVLLALATSRGEKIDNTALARRIRNGDHKAFRVFFNSHYDQLFRFLLSKGITSESAEDLIQQAFIYIWEHRQDIDPEKSLRAYIFKISYTRMLNLLRDHKKFSHDDPEQKQKTGDSPQQKMQHNEILDIIKKTIEEMPERRSMVFDMCFMQEFTYKETASAMDISVKTVENHMALALKDIRSVLTSRGFKPVE